MPAATGGGSRDQPESRPDPDAHQDPRRHDSVALRMKGRAAGPCHGGSDRDRHRSQQGCEERTQELAPAEHHQLRVALGARFGGEQARCPKPDTSERTRAPRCVLFRILVHVRI